MNIYLIRRTDNVGYDEWDSWVVAAKDEDQARKIGPSWDSVVPPTTAKPINDTTVQLVGKTIKGIKEGTILGSFNAG